MSVVPLIVVTINSGLEKYFLPVEEVQEQPLDRYYAQCHDKRFQHTGMIDKTVQENIGNDAELEQLPHHIDRDRIETYHYERERPFLVPADIDNPVEKRQK